MLDSLTEAKEIRTNISGSILAAVKLKASWLGQLDFPSLITFYALWGSYTVICYTGYYVQAQDSV